MYGLTQDPARVTGCWLRSRTVSEGYRRVRHSLHLPIRPLTRKAPTSYVVVGTSTRAYSRLRRTHGKMRDRSRSLTWHGQVFRFQLVTAAPQEPDSQWAVSRGGEFIGMMACSPEVSTKDFDLRGLGWLSDLLEAH